MPAETVDAVAVPADLLRSVAAHLRVSHAEGAKALHARLRALLDAHDSPDLFSPPTEPLRALGDAHMPRMHAAPTTQAMRRKVWPRSGSQRLRVVHLVAAAAEGLTDDDLERMTGRSHQSISACRNGLVADGWLQPRRHGNGTPVERRNRYGNAAQVWTITDAASIRLGVRP